MGSGAGDVQGGADYRPTDASLQVLDMIEKDLATAEAACDTPMDKEVPASDRANAARKIAVTTASS